MPDFTSGIQAASALSSMPLKGKRLGLIRETRGEGVSADVSAAIASAARHFEQLGAVVEEVRDCVQYNVYTMHISLVQPRILGSWEECWRWCMCDCMCACA